MTARVLRNYVNGQWVPSVSAVTRDVVNPATAETIAQVPMSTVEEARQAVDAAHEAFWAWRTTPPITRARYMFRLKSALERSFERIAETITIENGKTIDEARGEVRRAIENVDVACGVPSLVLGYNAEDAALGIDCVALRQPLGVFAHFAPFNFPAMVPYWYIPYALAAGNTFVLKPSDQTPMTQVLMTELMEEIDLPEGVFNLVHGAADVANAIMEHPKVRGVTFVGSTAVGKHVYAHSAANGKRALVQGGAKNYMAILPDANIDATVPAIMTSAYGCAGERCLAGSVVLAVGGIYERLTDRLAVAASKIKVGYGLDPATQMGPVISLQSKNRIVSYINRGVDEGARLLVDGRGIEVQSYAGGFFVGPTLFDAVRPEMTIAREEIFGPVLGVIDVPSIEICYKIIAENPYGNAASIFTSNGKSAREFAYRVECGNIGVNIGIAAPIAFFPFGGMKDSFFGVLHGQGQDVIQFFTDSKMVVSRWF